jgi:hypothetical protein
MSLKEVRALLQSALDEIDRMEGNPDPPRPAAAKPAKAEKSSEPEQSFVGFIAKPSLSSPRNIPLYKAGLRIPQEHGTNEFVNFQCWRELALWCDATLYRGSKVEITGTFKTESWTDREGVLQTKDVFNASKVEEI